MIEEKKVEEPTVVLEKLDNPHIAAMGPLKLNVVSFVNPVLGWFVGHWKLAIFITLCFVIFVEYELIGHYKAVAAADETVIITLNTSLATANAAIVDQNGKIDAAKQEGAAKQKELDSLQKTLKAKAVADQKTIDALRKKPIGTTCEDALKDMNDYIGTVKWLN